MPELSLEIVEGAGAGGMVAVGAGATIGRGRDADLVLADDHFLQFLLHELPMLAELLQHVAQTAGFGGQRRMLSG